MVLMAGMIGAFILEQNHFNVPNKGGRAGFNAFLINFFSILYFGMSGYFIVTLHVEFGEYEAYKDLMLFSIPL